MFYGFVWKMDPTRVRDCVIMDLWARVEESSLKMACLAPNGQLKRALTNHHETSFSIVCPYDLSPTSSSSWSSFILLLALNVGKVVIQGTQGPGENLWIHSCTEPPKMLTKPRLWDGDGTTCLASGHSSALQSGKSPSRFLVFLISFSVPCALCLQEFGTRTCHFAWYLLILACSPPNLLGIYFISGTSISHCSWYLLHVGTLNAATLRLV